jgi:hypothetical protein
VCVVCVCVREREREKRGNGTVAEAVYTTIIPPKKAGEEDWLSTRNFPPGVLSLPLVSYKEDRQSYRRKHNL